jgi:hypothetical protein
MDHVLVIDIPKFRFERIITRLDRLKVLNQDADFQFIFQVQAMILVQCYCAYTDQYAYIIVPQSHRQT